MLKLIRVTTVPISLEKLLENQLKYMSEFYEVIAVSSDKEKLEKFGIKEDIRTYHLEMTRQITPLKDAKALWKLYRFLRKEKPFIIHTHTPKAGVVGMLAAKMAGVPHRLHTVAGLPLLEAIGNKRKLLNFVEWMTYRCATHIYPNSKGLEEIIINEKFCNPEKLKVLGNGSSNGINTSFFDPNRFGFEEKEALKKELGITDEDFLFIFVGRLVGDKGINELVDAFKIASREINNIKLLLVGPFESNLDPLLTETLEEIESNKNIITTGHQNDVRGYLAISDVLVFPSYREGFPNVVMQAGAMGIPCIVTNINGCNEIILEGENGMIIPVKDKNAIYNAMMEMIENENLRIRLQRNARNMIVSRYEQNIIWDMILAEYKNLEKNV